MAKATPGGSILVFDIDGTLAKKGDGYSNLRDLQPKVSIVSIALAAQKPGMGRMAIVTARPEKNRSDTEAWVKKQGLRPEYLLMRKDSDPRPDYDVRVDQVREIMKKMGDNVTLYDDKESNCKAVKKSLGVNCVHVP